KRSPVHIRPSWLVWQHQPGTQAGQSGSPGRHGSQDGPAGCVTVSDGDCLGRTRAYPPLCAPSPVCWAAVTRAPNRNLWARLGGSHVVSIAVVRASGLDERSMRPARPVTGSTAEAIAGRVWLG